MNKTMKLENNTIQRRILRLFVAKEYRKLRSRLRTMLDCFAIRVLDYAGFRGSNVPLKLTGLLGFASTTPYRKSAVQDDTKIKKQKIKMLQTLF